MNPLTPRERELVALGAAMGSNCVPCIEHHIPQARQLGLSTAQIREAIELADKLRQVPAANVLAAAAKVLDDGSDRETNPSESRQCAGSSQQASRCC